MEESRVEGVGRYTLIDLGEDDNAWKSGMGVAGDGWVEDVDAFIVVSAGSWHRIKAGGPYALCHLHLLRS